MDKPDWRQAIRRRARLRLLFAGLVLGLYFAYLLNYLPSGSALGERLGSSWVTGSLAMFAGLVVIFLVLEWLFLLVDRDDDSGEG